MEGLILRKDGNLNNNFPKRVGWFGYWFLVYSSNAHCVFSCRLSMYCGSVRPEASDVKRTIALRHANSAASTWRLRYFSTCSWKILTLSIKVTILSGDMWFEWIPAVANRGATWRGIGHWAAFSTNNSLQTKRRSATWSVTAKSGKKGIFLAHSTALKSKRAANSQMFSMPMIPQGMFRPCWNRAVGYGSALSSKLMNPERNECPFVTSAPFNAECCGLGWGTCVGGMRPRWTASRLMPTLMHFRSRQYWHWFRWCWSMGQFRDARQV